MKVICEVGAICPEPGCNHKRPHTKRQVCEIPCKIPGGELRDKFKCVPYLGATNCRIGR